MRFMLLVKATPESEAGIRPSPEQMEAMRRFNASMSAAGVLLDGAGLHASSNGARVRLGGGQRTVIDGPFAETKELIAGYWMIEVKSPAEAVEWAKRCPAASGGETIEIEVRRVYEASECPGRTGPVPAE